jgi:hypothetical protein
MVKMQEEQARKPKIPPEEVLIARSPHYCSNLPLLVQSLLNYDQDD